MYSKTLIFDIVNDPFLRGELIFNGFLQNGEILEK